MILLNAQSGLVERNSLSANVNIAISKIYFYHNLDNIRLLLSSYGNHTETQENTLNQSARNSAQRSYALG